MEKSGLQVASLWRRVAAAAINGLLVLIAGGGGAAAAARWHSRRHGDEPFSIPWLDRLPNSRAVNRGVSLAASIAGRNSRSPGWRIVGLRYADAEGGGPVSIRSAAIRYAVATVLTEFARPAQQRALARARAREADFLGCAMPLVLVLVPSYVPMLWSPANQTLPERLAGIVVVVEH